VVKHFFQHNTIATQFLALTAAALLLAACNWLGLGGEPATPTPPDIFAPANNTTVLLGAPVQIQSGRFGSDVSRVELWVRKPSAAADELLRSDIPESGNLLQEWRPTEVGQHAITLRSYTGDNTSTQLVRTYQVILDDVVSLAPPAVPPSLAQSSGQGQPTVIPPTPLPVVPGRGAEFQTTDGAVIVQVVATSTSVPTATPIPRYPPPPPIPGVPPGPVQSPLLNVSPPVCDAAEYLGPYASDTSQRVVITEEDSIAAKVVGGTTVFRAWRLQNVGTCTWGPGYELTFYGGRSMGSGGVAFESTFPGEPARRNTLVDANRLIVPEGKPNQVAVIELQLVAPVTPGIHQSYWRMRNPHGVFFGPIIGVTMEVVRDCAFGIYGAPVINKFEILGVGNVYQPVNPVSVQAEVGQNVTLDYSIINATNFDIVFVDPTGNTQSVSTQDQNGRFTFPAKTLGRNVITLYADNGSCTVPATVYVDVVPRAGEQFELDIILASGAQVSTTDTHVKFSSAVAPGTAVMSYTNQVDPTVTSVQAHLQKWQRGPDITTCLVGDVLCGTTKGGWQPLTSGLSTEIGSAAAGSATINSQFPTEIQATGSPTATNTTAQQTAFACSEADSASNVEVAVSFCGQAQLTTGGPRISDNSPWYICGLNKEVTDRPPPPSTCSGIASSSSAATSTTGVASQTTNPSCGLTLLGRTFTVPIACDDVPMVAGVSLVLLIVVLWIIFK
jgi:hypothetical protein